MGPSVVGVVMCACRDVRGVPVGGGVGVSAGGLFVARRVVLFVFCLFFFPRQMSVMILSFYHSYYFLIVLPRFCLYKSFLNV